MQKKQQVAIIDVGSSKITAVVAERGINKTFLFKGRFEYPYEGYADGAFFEEEALSVILRRAVSEIRKSSGDKISTVYVGVPGAFTSVMIKDSQISFDNKKKIKDEDVDALFDAAFVLTSEKYALINRSAIVYELDDYRRLASPIGETSGILKGKLSFILCDKYFIEKVVPPISSAGIKNVECVSVSLAEALYLIDDETRDRISLMLDVGYISSTLSLVQGDGIIMEKSFQFGGGYLTAAISEKFGIDFDSAEKLKRKINLCSNSDSEYDVIDCENGSYYSYREAKDAVITALDSLCESIDECLESLPYTLPSYVPLLVTGGGIPYLRGAKEHISSRLGIEVRTIASSVPLKNKPDESSVLSLLDLALEQ